MIADTDRKTFRREMDQLIQARLRALLAQRTGDLAQRLDEVVPSEKEWAGKVKLLFVALCVVREKRGEKFHEEAGEEIGALVGVEGPPQSKGGRAALRCQNLLLVLLARGIKKRGELPESVKRLRLTA